MKITHFPLIRLFLPILLAVVLMSFVATAVSTLSAAPTAKRNVAIINLYNQHFRGYYV
ncbi:hypothetical protein MNBD_CHLOROFLEXI01-4234 [hydrothermal vent metagenome]|uniref:Uncharacterized protein n=1 Tax=hydrothermal vent metagenome TaxID=652676 RepID=A0A3B0VD47_9ZZZZ